MTRIPHPLGSEETRAILEERARRLARPHPSQAPVSRRGSVAFSLGGERFAIELPYVLHVDPLGSLTPVPGSPAFVVGVTAWRGQIVPVLELAKLLGLRSPGVTNLSRILVLGQEHPEVGLLADVVEGITHVDESTLTRSTHSAPVNAPDGRFSSVVTGVVPAGPETGLIVLDGAALVRARPAQDDSKESSWRTR